MVRLLLIALLTTFSASVEALFFYAGAESYHFDRWRDGGTSQEGRIDGVRVGFDRVKPWCWYFGADYLYAAGDLSGTTGSGLPLRSDLTDQIFEVRAGFTLTQPLERCPFFTPFTGWGHFREVNDFKPPSPLPCRFTDVFDYVVVGFLSGVNFTPLLSMGVNFKVRFMLDGKSHISNDPQFGNVTLTMEDETQYRLDIPIYFNLCDSLFGIGVGIVPFYEFRHFGGREGYPFNFRDTKFHLYGTQIVLTKCF